MSTVTTLVRADCDVVDTALDDQELALLHLRTKTYFTLNATGGRIWRYVKDGVPLEEISRRIQEEFAVDADRAADSVNALVDELVRHELAQRV